MRVRFLFFAWISVWPALACSCASSEPVKACEIYQSMPVIFRGRVIDHNHDSTAGFGQMTLYRFKVLEAFKGLPPGVHEVFIDPASMTSCYRVFNTDSDYLVYTGGADPTPVAVSVFQGPPPDSPAKRIPAAWKGLGQLPVYSVGECNPTRTVEENDADLAYLRSSGKIGPAASGWIEGRAVQNLDSLSPSADCVAAADATLTVTSPSGNRRRAAVQTDGTFRVGPLPPGTYAISAQSPVLGTGEFEEPSVEVPPGGCAVAIASFKTNATISGKVLDADGKPAYGARLQLGELQAGGRVREVPGAPSWTDRRGGFRIENVPVGRIVLAANLNGAPTEEMPFDTVYAPGTQSASAARVFGIQPGQVIADVVLHLPKPLPFGDLYVEVKWPDGSPALGGARAWAEWKKAEAGFGGAPASTNRVKLRLALERRYEIRVDWTDFKPGKFLFVEGAAPQTLDFTHDGQVVEMRLKNPHPQ
jgi:hypothetical protein